jgi:hypothetical protein
MKKWLRGSSSQGSGEKENEEKKKPKYNIPRATEVRPWEWPSDTFLRAARIYDDFYFLAENAGITAFLQDKCEQYLYSLIPAGTSRCGVRLGDGPPPRARDLFPARHPDTPR